MKKKSKYWRFLLILAVLSILMSVTALFPSACDWYTDHIYGYLSSGIAFVTNLIPIPISEIVLICGAAMLVLSIPILLLLMFLRKKPKYRKFCAGWFKTALTAVACVLFLCVPCALLPVCSHVLGADRSALRTEFNFKELTALYSYLTEGINQAAEEIEISPDGTVDFYTVEEMQPLLEEAMRGCAADYPRLGLYYPQTKASLISDLHLRMGIGGVTYPPAMEATYNKYEPPVFQPVLNAHELAHVKGFIKENEANFISMTALSQSRDPLLRFSAYDDMLRYVYEHWEAASDAYLQELAANGEITLPVLPEFHQGMTQEEKKAFREAASEWARIRKEVLPDLPESSERVMQILNASEGIREETYQEDSHPIDELPAVQEAISSANETYWQVYNVYMQDNTYDGVVLLLLQHFDGILY